MLYMDPPFNFYAVLNAMRCMTLEDFSEELSVYIGNVDWNATARELQCHFSPCGPMKRVTIPVDNGIPRGYAFIEFESKESKENALLLNQSYFRGRLVTIVGKRTKPNDSFSVYVGSVDWTTTTNELRQYFAPCGPMKRVTIPFQNGMSKGYAYIEFENKESKENALLLNQTEFKGRILTIHSKRTNIQGYNNLVKEGQPHS